MTVTPIFLFSLPRSGSTLLQRIIASHPSVATAAEPWLLLPLVHAVRADETYSEYNHKAASAAIQSFIQKLPNGPDDYYASLRRFVLELYAAASQGKPFFLDKTPRYHAIALDIIRIFPDARFVFLFRHPLAVYSSIIQTWQLSHIFRYDLYKGFDRLYEAFQAAREKSYFVTYEGLVQAPEATARALCTYIGIDFLDEMIKDFSRVKMQTGEYGNPVPAQTEQNKIVDTSVERWMEELRKNYVRRSAALSYLDFISEERMSQLGYDYTRSREALLSEPAGMEGILLDIANVFRGMLSTSLDTQILRDKLQAIGEGKRIYAHR